MRLFTLHTSGTFFYHTRDLALLFFIGAAMEDFACACSHCMPLALFFITRVAWCCFFLLLLLFCLALLFCVGALLAAAFISLPTSLYKHHEVAICLEYIYSETP
jgi:hypothetical protein